MESLIGINPSLFIGLLVIAGLLGTLLLLQKKRTPRRSGRYHRITKLSRQADGISPAEPLFPSSQNLAQKMVLDETGMFIPEVVVSETSSDDLRKRIEQKIDTILPLKPARDSEIEPLEKMKELNPHLRKALLHHIDHLKNFRSTYQLYQALDDPNVNLSELSKIITTDPVLTGKVLKIANSSYFGMQQKVNSIGHALMIIGLLNIKTILYQDGLLRLLKSKQSVDDFVIDSLWEHAPLTAVCSSHIQNLFGGLDKGTLFTLGLLHDIGKFVMNNLTPANARAMDPVSVSTTEFTIHDEEKIYGVNHAVVGRLLFDQWGFPEQMGKIIENHHDPSITRIDSECLDGKDLKYLLVLFLSDQIAKVFASEDKNTSPLARLAPHYYPLFERKRFLGLVQDSSLFSEIKKAKTLAKSR